MEFELSYTAVQEQFRNEVRAWLVENVPDGITARPRSFEESRAIYLLRRELGRKLGANGWVAGHAPPCPLLSTSNEELGLTLCPA